jgi:antitoxin component YwqK of YwqJK toxin-antitoxin module
MKVSRLLLVIGLCGLAGLVRALQPAPVDPAERTQTTYYAGGQVRSTGSFRDGRREGPSQAFYPDGSKKAEGLYENGQMSGEWSFWLPNGELDAEHSGRYARGERSQL